MSRIRFRATVRRTCYAKLALRPTLLRLLLALAISGVWAPAPASVAAAAGDLQITQPAVGGLIQAIQPAAATILARAGARIDLTGRRIPDAPFAALAAGIPSPSVGHSSSPIPSGTASRRIASRGSASLRGPPDTL